MHGITTEAGEYADQFKRHIFYHQPLDEVNLIEELGDVMWYVGLACNVLGTTIRDVQVANIRKLQKRYPEKFTVDHAINRDTANEVNALLSGMVGLQPSNGGADMVAKEASEGLHPVTKTQESLHPTIPAHMMRPDWVNAGDMVESIKTPGVLARVVGAAPRGGGSGLAWNNNWAALLQLEATGQRVEVKSWHEFTKLWKPVAMTIETDDSVPGDQEHQDYLPTTDMVEVGDDGRYENYVSDDDLDSLARGGRMVYLACPRAHEDSRVVGARYAVANKMTADLMIKKDGLMVFSPVSHGHGPTSFVERGKFEDPIMRLNLRMLSACDAVLVITINGWKESRGVSQEINKARELGIPVLYLNPDRFGMHIEFPYIIPDA
jgi:NTP pyrophosphatase (non-canonical NTP hydrolase)